MAVTAGWGIVQKRAVMPGAGRYDVRERAAADNDGLGSEDRDVLGDQVLDIYLNEHVRWRGVPAAVWDYKIGGFQVLRKWLSYRDKRVLGRDLTMAETRALPPSRVGSPRSCCWDRSLTRTTQGHRSDVAGVGSPTPRLSCSGRTCTPLSWSSSSAAASRSAASFRAGAASSWFRASGGPKINAKRGARENVGVDACHTLWCYVNCYADSVATLVIWLDLRFSVELRGFEPLTYSMRTSRATNCAIAPDR